MKFDLEAFKAGQKALTRDGRVAKFIAICDECDTDKLVVKVDNLHHVSCYPLDGMCYNQRMQLVSMVSRHQHLIDSYDPEDTWEWSDDAGSTWFIWVGVPCWDEEWEWRLHPHNDLIKAWKKGAKIEAYIVGDWVEDPYPDWYYDTQYRIKPESVIHCLAYDASLDPNPKLWGAPVVSEKQLAIKNGWKIIQEWEV